jgi:hypothetical protein
VPGLSTTLHGTFTVVVQLDNPVDAPGAVVQTGSFTGDVDLSAAVAGVAPLGFIRNGVFTIDSTGQTGVFSGVFRLPFGIAGGKRVTPRAGQDAFYLSDHGVPFPVTLNERSMGWPTVRLEISF